MSARLFKVGFTLIELLVVISIIGILATLVVANLNSARSRARDAARKSDLKNIQSAMRLYYNDKGAYPATFNLFGSKWNDGTTVYMERVPQDPLPDQCYTYNRPVLDSDSFSVIACLENKSDKQGSAPKVALVCPCPTDWVFEVTQ